MIMKMVIAKGGKMNLNEIIAKINDHCKSHNLPELKITTRPSSFDSNKTTIEVWYDSELIAKSVNGGAINWFLKGMWTAFFNTPAPILKNFNNEIYNISRNNYNRIAE